MSNIRKGSIDGKFGGKWGIQGDGSQKGRICSGKVVLGRRNRNELWWRIS